MAPLIAPAVEGKQATNVLILPPRRGALFGQTCSRAGLFFPLFPFLSSDPLVLSNVEELTTADMALFQIIVQQVLPFCRS